jgi:hypothetical protein
MVQPTIGGREILMVKAALLLCLIIICLFIVVDTFNKVSNKAEVASKNQAAVKSEPKPKPEPTPEQKAEEARWQRDVLAVRQLRAGMKNPDSFKLEQALRMDDGSLCLSYRATNSFNAIVPGNAVIADNTIRTSDNRERFAPVWNKRCAKKSGRDITYIRRAL